MSIQDLTVYDKLRAVPFRGEQVAAVTWDYEEAASAGFPRWTDMTLYRVEPGSSCAYRVQIVARSVVYHGIGGCPKGVKLPVGMLAKDDDRYGFLAACEQCLPPDLDDLDDNAIVKVEQDLPELHEFADAAALVPGLLGRRKSGGLTTKLLAAAAGMDQDIAAALGNNPIGVHTK